MNAKAAAAAGAAAGKRLSAVWLVLSAVTLVYLGMDYAVDRSAAHTASAAVTLGAIAIALVKVRIVVREFMEVRRAPVLLGRLTDGLVAVIGAALLGSYLLGNALR